MLSMWLLTSVCGFFLGGVGVGGPCPEVMNESRITPPFLEWDLPPAKLISRDTTKKTQNSMKQAPHINETPHLMSVTLNAEWLT